VSSESPVTYHNRYNGVTLEYAYANCPKESAMFRDSTIRRGNHFDLVEMRIKGRWLRPPVGMRADQCSHVWRKVVRVGEADQVRLCPRAFTGAAP